MTGSSSAGVGRLIAATRLGVTLSARCVGARFEPYFKGMIRNARSAIPQQPMTVDRLMSMDSTMPRAVAEWQIARMKQGGEDEFPFLSSQFAGIASPRDLFALSIGGRRAMVAGTG